MKKLAFTIVVLLTLGVATGMAEIITFSTCTAGDLTAPGGINCGGVNFSYDFNGASGTNIAVLDFGGVVISAGSDPVGLEGVLDLTFTAPNQSMTFDFVIGPAANLTNLGFGLLVNLFPSEDFAATDPANCTVVGLDCGGTVSFAPASAPFNIANITPNSDATYFTMSSLSFEAPAVATVPEPSIYALLGSYLLLLGFGGRKLIKRRS